MVALFVKRGIWIGIGLLALVLAATAVASLFAGNRIAATDLTFILEEATGRRVVFKDQPTIRIFPAFTAEFREFALYDWTSADNQYPVLKAPILRLSLSIFDALKNKATITGLALEKPVFAAKAEGGDWQTPVSNEARLVKIISGLKAILPNLPSSETLASIRSISPAKIMITKGIIAFNSSQTDVISDLEATFAWPTGNSSGSLKATGVWRGEAALLNVTTDDLVMLAAGVDTGTSIVFQSKPLTSRFTGFVRLLPAPYIEGSLFAQSDSLLAATNWQGFKTPIESPAFGLTLSGALKADAGKWQLEDSQLQLGTNKGTGSLVFQNDMRPRLLSGTLDFESLDLAMLAKLFEPGFKQNRNEAQSLAADLRISANAASYNTLALNNVAASLRVSNQTNALDIHNAAAFGGTLQLALKTQIAPALQTELRILASDIETEALAGLGGVFADLPHARGSLSAIVHGENAANPEFFESAAGTVKLRLGAGTLPGINANQMVSALRKGGFFTLNAKAPSVLSFNELNAEATLAQGTLQFSSLHIGLDKAALTLSGTYAVKDQSVALTGSLDLEAGHPDAPKAGEVLSVFFGGNRHAPLMSTLGSIQLKK